MTNTVSTYTIQSLSHTATLKISLCPVSTSLALTRFDHTYRSSTVFPLPALTDFLRSLMLSSPSMRCSGLTEDDQASLPRTEGSNQQLPSTEASNTFTHLLLHLLAALHYSRLVRYPSVCQGRYLLSLPCPPRITALLVWQQHVLYWVYTRSCSS